MSSLSARLLVSVSVLLLLFFGATIVVLDLAFRHAGEQARQDILDGHLMSLLAAAEPTDDGTLGMPPDMPNLASADRLRPVRRDSRRAGRMVWRSRSALGLEIPAG